MDDVFEFFDIFLGADETGVGVKNMKLTICTYDADLDRFILLDVESCRLEIEGEEGGVFVDMIGHGM
ncbi:MAG: hypothetical protein H6766_04240 [Candidatus Peribacteria bacterium]|nr:MAG: hypothetical protein H6766_04240 [Candidatus Peribacteria bacterium]